VWNYKSADFNELNTALSNAPFETAYTIFDDVVGIVNYTNGLILSTCSEFIHATIATIRHNEMGILQKITKNSA
jgi:hypothetical protein